LTLGIAPRVHTMRTSPRVTALLATVLFSSANALHIAITGTSQGIGLDAAKRLIRDGHTVYHANRNAARSAEAAQQAGGGVAMVCDLSSLASVRQFADELSGKELDVLCLNAGIAPSTKAEAPDTTADGFESCIGTNHLGHFLLANLLAPKVTRIVVTARVEIATATLSSRRRVDGVEGMIQPWARSAAKI
jgi:protochlorophyllide reductase